MKKYFRPGLVAAVALLALSSCSDDFAGAGNGETGKIVLNLDIERGVLVGNNVSRGSYQEIADGLTADDFKIRLTDENGNSQEWGFAEFNGANIKTGNYTLTAYSGTEGAQGFDAAYFSGSTKVTVYNEQTSSATVTTALTNAAVKVTYTDGFKAYMTDYAAEVRPEGDADALAYDKGHSDELFINPGSTALYVSFTTIQGKSATLKAAEFDALAQHIYNITVDVDEGVSDAVLTVTFDDTTVAEDRDFVLSDELFYAPAPTMTPATFSFDYIDGNYPGDNVEMTILAHGGLAEVNVQATGDGFAQMGWPERVNLLDPANRSTLQALGLTAMGLWSNPDRMAVVNFTNVLKALRAVQGGDNNNKLTVEVVDNYGKVSTPCGQITAKVTPITFEIVGHGVVSPGATEVEIIIASNSNDPGNGLRVECLYPDRGLWDDAPVKSVVSNGDGTFTITVGIPASNDDVKLRFYPHAAPMVECSYERIVPTVGMSIANADIYATALYITITSTEADPSQLTKFVTVDVEDLTAAPSPAPRRRGVRRAPTVKVEGPRVKVEGFTPGHNYRVTVKFFEQTEVFEITTEAALQLANGDMETWTQTGSQSNWKFFHPGNNDGTDIWSTLNGLTTSTNSSQAFRSTSSTLKTDDAHSGSAAALVRTVGWGSGNSLPTNGFLGLGAKDATIQNITAGELFLGSYNGGAVYGIPFTSRPTSMTFYAKYTPFTGEDTGYAEIDVLNAEGTVIASATTNIESSTSWQTYTLPLAYTGNAGKAATLKVIFRSSTTALQANKNYLNQGSSSSGNGFSFVGSQLKIDDITLNY